MFRTLLCVRDHHDYKLVLLAALICMVSSAGALHLFQRARMATGARLRWLLTAALATGFGIWATHFIAMLAYDPGVVVGYDLSLTLLSLITAVVITGTGLAMALYARFRFAPALGGGVVGLGIAAMHFMGMMALKLPGWMSWQPDLVIAALVFSIGFAAAAVCLACRTRAARVTPLAATLLILAIVLLHFTAMGAVVIHPDPLRNLGGLSLSPANMSALITAGVIAVFSVCLSVSVFGYRLETALGHMAQGLCLYDHNERLVLANARFYQIFGLSRQRLSRGMRARDVVSAILERRDGQVPDADALDAVYERHKAAFTSGGGTVIAEISPECVLSIAYTVLPDGGCVITYDDITARRRDEERIAHLARYDSLTQLPNRDHLRQWLDEELAQAAVSGQRLVVMAIDLDRFKEINDLRGHAAGDAVLRAIAGRMSASLRPGEFVARLGGDEFVAVKRLMADEDHRPFLNHIVASLNDTIDLEGFEVQCGGSVGVALFPQDGDSFDALLNNADLALYRAKASHDEKVCYYEARMDEAARHRRAMAKALWEAADRDELELHYQVQKAIDTGRITGYEALLRWRRDGALISPADFIPVAEECGAIVEIGKWVLRTACLEAAKWPDDIKIAVNLSPVQLVNIDIIHAVREVLIETGLPPQRLELEVTESAIITDTTRALHILRQIKALGVTFAIDDFGTGYSSLATLNAFPFDKIKIDQSFLRDAESNPQSRAIVRAIIALGKSLNMPVLAEGVETQAQALMLKDEGCEEAQGYLLGRPQPLVDPDDLRAVAT
jgi:diguanylate cyclase (GGDEF)-like protein